MAWFSGKVSLGNFPDLAGAVNKFSEISKNIEKNFDSALGFEDKAGATTSATEASASWPSDLMSFMGQKDEDKTVESIENVESSSPKEKEEAEVKSIEKLESSSPKDKEEAEVDNSADSSNELKQSNKEENVEETSMPKEHEEESAKTSTEVLEEANSTSEKPSETNIINIEHAEITEIPLETKIPLSEDAENITEKSVATNVSSSDEPQVDSQPELNIDQAKVDSQSEASPLEKSEPIQNESTDSVDQVIGASDLKKVDPTSDSQKDEEVSTVEVAGPAHDEVAAKDSEESSMPSLETSDDASLKAPEPEIVVLKDENEKSEVHVLGQLDDIEDNQSDIKEKELNSESDSSKNEDSRNELEKVTREMKMMETALLGAARQAQAKADEIAKLMNENEQLKSIIEDQRRKPNEADIESLREEYHQRVSTLERKVYALTKERDTLRREQNKKSDAAALLKEKDEIITQIMAEGEGLSKKQAAQESQIRKLRAQIREFEEEKKGLISKLQVEENKVESIKRDKAATEKLLQITIEKNQAELATQKEYYTNALNAAKEAEALAEARANTEARSELESRLKEAEERELMLVQTLEELRQTLSRTEQQAVFREDMLRRDVEDLQKRYQESERRCEELVMQVPDSTRPLLRQIEAMQETTARRAEAWAAVERSLTSRLQEAEAKSASAEERERSVNERLSQTLSRINVLEAQISILRAEQTQLSRSLEKERQKAAESRQEYLALKEEVDTHVDHVNQLEEEIKELKRKHKQELQEALTHRELLQQDIEREKAARLELETTARLQSSIVPDQTPLARTKSAYENGLSRRLSNASSLGSMEESFYLQASLDSSDTFSEKRNYSGEPPINSYYLKSMTPNAFEAALRQKEGELASYMSRLASMESIRDSLAEELVKMTEECEKLRSEVSQLPGLKADIEALRRRHSAALELMGERDEELEELRADIVDLKEMYREQVNMLVNKIQVLSSSISAA